MDIRLFAFADEAGSVIDTQIKTMKRNGLQGLEVRDVDGTNISKITEEKAKELRSKLDDAGLITWSIGSPIGKISIDGDFEAHMNKLRHTLDVGNILGAGNIRLFSFYMPEGRQPADYAGEVIDKLGKIAQTCMDSGITPCHENEKLIFGDNAERCAYILRQLPQLQGIFDPANFVQCGQDTLEAWNLLKSRTKYLHIKDAFADGKVVPAGQGVGNVKAIVSEYVAMGGRELTLEPHLFKFKGLQELERSGLTSDVGSMAFADAASAFDSAVSALRNILAKM